MITRKAILLRYAENLHEELRINRDFELVKTFLKSAPGGCFDENEIIELKTNKIEDEIELFKLIDAVDYTFIYFSGHSAFINRRINLPLKDKLMSAIELQRDNKRQWLFFDTCRTSLDRVQSPVFSFERADIKFTEKNPESHRQWTNDITLLPSSTHINYYCTEIGKYAFTNEQGGYGTQLFFKTLSELLKTKSQVNLKEVESIINQNTIQKATLIGKNGEKFIFRN
jgi:hypothetical protein